MFIGWIGRHKIGIGEIARTTPYFNANKLEFSFPAAWRIRFSAIGTCILGPALIIGSAIFGASDYALIYVKKTKATFWINAGQAYSAGYPITSHHYSTTGEAGTWRTSIAYSQTLPPLDDDWDKKVICHLIVG